MVLPSGLRFHTQNVREHREIVIATRVHPAGLLYSVFSEIDRGPSVFREGYLISGAPGIDFSVKDSEWYR